MFRKPQQIHNLQNRHHGGFGTGKHVSVGKAVLTVPGISHDPAPSKTKSVTDMLVVSSPACHITQPMKVWDTEDFPSCNNQQRWWNMSWSTIFNNLFDKGEILPQ